MGAWNRRSTVGRKSWAQTFQALGGRIFFISDSSFWYHGTMLARVMHGGMDFMELMNMAGEMVLEAFRS